MLTFALQSGSCGNSYYYESGPVKLLFDAGIPWRLAAARMAERGVTPDAIQGIFISHDHSDHFACAGVFHRMTKAPLFLSGGTWASVGSRMGKLKACETFVAGDEIRIGHVRVSTLLTPHDASEPCAFIVDDGKTRVGILTDLGHCFPELCACLAELDVAYLESNFDAALLASNIHYPEHLKRRIRGRHGHLENGEAAEMIQTYNTGRLQTVILSHLSAENNSPAAALAAHRRAAADPTFFTPPPPRLLVAPRTAASPRVEL